MAIPLGKPLDDPSIPDSNFEVMPVGEYMGVIEKATETTSKNDNPMLEIVVRLEGNEKYNGRKLWHYLVFGQEHSLEAAKKLMIALNQDIAGLRQIDGERLVGLPCKIKTKHEEFRGETTDKIHYFCNMGPTERELAAEKNNKAEDIDLGDDIPF